MFYKMNKDDQKKAIRKEIRNIKKNYSFEEKNEMSKIILKKLENDDSFKKSTIIMMYWSMEDEVQTIDFIEKWFSKKRIILPCVDGTNLRLKEYKGYDNLIEGENFGILEPIGEEFKEIDAIDLIIVPGVAFDLNNNRMGRGKAYYDKLLKLTCSKKIGICFNFQLLKSVPIDQHDVKMDRIISN